MQIRGAQVVTGGRTGHRETGSAEARLSLGLGLGLGGCGCCGCLCCPLFLAGSLGRFDASILACAQGAQTHATAGRASPLFIVAAEETRRLSIRVRRGTTSPSLCARRGSQHGAVEALHAVAAKLFVATLVGAEQIRAEIQIVELLVSLNKHKRKQTESEQQTEGENRDLPK